MAAESAINANVPTVSRTADPRAEYTRRLDACRQMRDRLGQWEAIFGNARVFVFVAGLVLLYFILGFAHIGMAWLMVPALLFLAVLMGHERVRRDWRRLLRLETFYQQGLERLAGRWAGRGDPGTRFLDADHLYAADLDIFGTGSLFERLCTTQTQGGADILADWLSKPAMPEEIHSRQEAIIELRDRLDLREEMMLFGSTVPAGIDLAGLVRWGEERPILETYWSRCAAPLIVSLSLSALLGWFAEVIGPAPFLFLLIVQGGFALWRRTGIRRVLAPVDRRAHDLAFFAGILARLEQEKFSTPRLCRLQASLKTGGELPSRHIRKLIHLVQWLDSLHNPYLAFLAMFVLGNTQLALAVEAWRVASGRDIGRWLETVAEFEALSALSAYSYENPGDPFPEIVVENACFDATGLGHPLLTEDRCVGNDLRLNDALRVLVVSGSNMSGKSTLLRTVGTNVVLALAGAPVRAKHLRLSPLAVGATLHIQDSLQAGRSRFYTEITRIRRLVDLAKGPTPLLFLLDEIFHGTNSHDRRQGAEAVVRSLVQLGAIGLVTTHDLALTHIADSLAPRAANVHFEDRLEGDTVVFDYHLRPGIVQHSNALALMRAVGLDV